MVLLATAGRHGLHGDELYFRMLPLAWWYDDQPPLTIWLTRLAASTSDAVWVQRIPAVVAAAAGSVLAALFPRLLGYGPGVQAVAAGANAFTVDGYKRQLVDEALKAVGTRVRDVLDLVLLDPAYRASYADGSTLLVRAGHDAMRAEIAAECGSLDAAAFDDFVLWLRALYRLEMPHRCV